MKRFRIITVCLSLIALSALIVTNIASAQNVQTGDSVTVSSNKTIDNMLFAAGDSINIAGTVNGDVYCAGQSVNISGTVNGDVICAGQTVTISGTVTGDARLAGSNILINGRIDGSSTVATQDLTIGEKGVIDRDLLGGSQNITIDGKVNRDILAGSETLIVNGKVGRNIQGEISTINVGSTGIVNGTANYTGENDPAIASGGKIVGNVTRSEPKDQSSSNASNEIWSKVTFFIYSLLSMGIIALLLVWLSPKMLDETVSGALKSPVKTFLIGLGGAIVAPVITIMLFMTFIGIPLGFLTILVWLSILIMVTPLVGYFIGRLILGKAKKPTWTILFGVLIITILSLVPIIGLIIGFIAYPLTIGMLLKEANQLLHRSTKTNQ